MQVMGPLVFLLLAAATILSVWTAIDPLVWEREEIASVPAETYGQCSCNHFELFFFSLTGLLLFSKIAAALMAWKTADIPQDFSDTSSVFYAISTQIQAWFIGVPILVVLGNDSVDATYFARVLLVWVFAVSGPSLVLFPRIIQAVQIRRNPDRAAPKSRVRISGLPSGSSNQRTSHSTSYRGSLPKRASVSHASVTEKSSPSLIESISHGQQTVVTSLDESHPEHVLPGECESTPEGRCCELEEGKTDQYTPNTSESGVKPPSCEDEGVEFH